MLGEKKSALGGKTKKLGARISPLAGMNRKNEMRTEKLEQGEKNGRLARAFPRTLYFLYTLSPQGLYNPLINNHIDGENKIIIKPCVWNQDCGNKIVGKNNIELHTVQTIETNGRNVKTNRHLYPQAKQLWINDIDLSVETMESNCTIIGGMRARKNWASLRSDNYS